SIGLIDHLFYSALHAIRVPEYPIGAFGLSSCKGCYACWIVKPFPITDIMWNRKYTKIIIALNGSYKWTFKSEQVQLINLGCQLSHR
ncbi:hypothetical protein, partial [Klebsiella grimontii]|uniref:hypothetical protein n=1 Tax=Klebsiella grimontii TaxID=2058152 RepID=UPI001CCBFF40